MGVHLNLPESQGIDAVAREHLIRVWWTSYIFDQTCAIANGNVVSVSDDEILTDLPSNKMIGEADQEDFKGTESMVSRIHLAKLTSSIMKSLYGRTKQTEPFLQRVQLALKNLKGWVTAFSESLSMGNHTPASLPQGASLHLVVNQVRALPIHLFPNTAHLHICTVYDTGDASCPPSRAKHPQRVDIERQQQRESPHLR